MWKLERDGAQRLSVDPGAFTDLLSAITVEDDAELPRAILGLARSEVDIINCAIFHVPARGDLRLLGHAEVVETSRIRKVATAYAQRYYLRDMALHHAARESRGRGGPATLLLHQGVEDIPDPEYRTVCYEANDTAHRFAVYRPLAAGGGLLIGLYRPRGAADFSGSDLRFLSATAAWLAEAAEQRWRAMPPAGQVRADALDALIAEAGVKPSRREYEVLAAIADGLTLSAASERLGIEASSAVTYRNRGFSKLGLRSRAEYFTRLLQASRRTPVQ